MSERVFDGRIAREIAPDDRERHERLKATARALVTAVRDGLVRDGEVRLHGFGTFRLRPVAARRGRNPRTGEPIDIPAGWRVIFRPAKALRERVEPDRAPALPIGEPHASREAMLAASAADAAQTIRRGAGRIPAEGIAAPPPMEPERAAAAAMSERKLSVQGPIPPGPADLEADSRVTRWPAALTRAPAANEPAPTEALATESPATEPTGAPDSGRRRNGYRYALVLLLVLLVAGLAWLSRPVDSPVSTVAEESGPSAPGEVPGDATGGAPDTAITSDQVVSEESDATTAGTGATSGQGGTEEEATVAEEMADAPSTATADRDVPASTDDTGAAGEGKAGAGETEVAGAADEAAEVSVTAAPDSDEPAASRGTGSVDEDGAGAGQHAVASTETTTGQTGTGEASTRVDEPTFSAGAGSDSGDEVMAALSRAAEASTGAPIETTSTSTGTAAAGDPGGEAATDAGAMSGVASADDTASGETGSVQTRPRATGPSAGAPDQSQAATGAVAGARATDKAPADAGPWFSGRDYTVRAGDTLWDLADRHYVNPYYWPHIWNHNAGITNPDRLEVQQGLWLPTLDGDPRSLTEADRRSIAEGYLRLYRFFREQGDANPQYALVGVRYFDASVLPERLRGSAAGHPGDTLAAAFQTRLEAEFPLD